MMIVSAATATVSSDLLSMDDTHDNGTNQDNNCEISLTFNTHRAVSGSSRGQNAKMPNIVRPPASDVPKDEPHPNTDPKVPTNDRTQGLFNSPSPTSVDHPRNLSPQKHSKADSHPKSEEHSRSRFHSENSGSPTSSKFRRLSIESQTHITTASKCTDSVEMETHAVTPFAMSLPAISPKASVNDVRRTASPSFAPPTFSSISIDTFSVAPFSDTHFGERIDDTATQSHTSRRRRRSIGTERSAEKAFDSDTHLLSMLLPSQRSSPRSTERSSAPSPLHRLNGEAERSSRVHSWDVAHAPRKESHHNAGSVCHDKNEQGQLVRSLERVAAWSDASQVDRESVYRERDSNKSPEKDVPQAGTFEVSPLLASSLSATQSQRVTRSVEALPVPCHQSSESTRRSSVPPVYAPNVSTPITVTDLQFGITKLVEKTDGRPSENNSQHKSRCPKEAVAVHEKATERPVDICIARRVDNSDSDSECAVIAEHRLRLRSPPMPLQQDPDSPIWSLETEEALSLDGEAMPLSGHSRLFSPSASPATPVPELETPTSTPFHRLQERANAELEAIQDEDAEAEVVVRVLPPPETIVSILRNSPRRLLKNVVDEDVLRNEDAISEESLESRDLLPKPSELAAAFKGLHSNQLELSKRNLEKLNDDKGCRGSRRAISKPSQISTSRRTSLSAMSSVRFPTESLATIVCFDPVDKPQGLLAKSRRRRAHGQSLNARPTKFARPIPKSERQRIAGALSPSVVSSLPPQMLATIIFTGVLMSDSSVAMSKPVLGGTESETKHEATKSEKADKAEPGLQIRPLSRASPSPSPQNPEKESSNIVRSIQANGADKQAVLQVPDATSRPSDTPTQAPQISQSVITTVSAKIPQPPSQPLPPKASTRDPSANGRSITAKALEGSLAKNYVRPLSTTTETARHTTQPQNVTSARLPNLRDRSTSSTTLTNSGRFSAPFGGYSQPSASSANEVSHHHVVAATTPTVTPTLSTTSSSTVEVEMQPHRAMYAQNTPRKIAPSEPAQIASREPVKQTLADGNPDYSKLQPKEGPRVKEVSQLSTPFAKGVNPLSYDSKGANSSSIGRQLSNGTTSSRHQSKRGRRQGDRGSHLVQLPETSSATDASTSSSHHQQADSVPDTAPEQGFQQFLQMAASFFNIPKKPPTPRATAIAPAQAPTSFDHNPPHPPRKISDAKITTGLSKLNDYDSKASLSRSISSTRDSTHRKPHRHRPQRTRHVSSKAGRSSSSIWDLTSASPQSVTTQRATHESDTIPHPNLTREFSSRALLFGLSTPSNSQPPNHSLHSSPPIGISRHTSNARISERPSTSQRSRTARKSSSSKMSPGKTKMSSRVAHDEMSVEQAPQSSRVAANPSSVTPFQVEPSNTTGMVLPSERDRTNTNRPPTTSQHTSASTAYRNPAQQQPFNWVLREPVHHGSTPGMVPIAPTFAPMYPGHQPPATIQRHKTRQQSMSTEFGRDLAPQLEEPSKRQHGSRRTVPHGQRQRDPPRLVSNLSGLSRDFNQQRSSGSGRQSSTHPLSGHHNVWDSAPAQQEQHSSSVRRRESRNCEGMAAPAPSERSARHAHSHHRRHSRSVTGPPKTEEIRKTDDRSHRSVKEQQNKEQQQSKLSGFLAAIGIQRP